MAQQIIYGAFDRVSKATGRDPLEVYNQALENIMPQLEVRSRRVGGANYQVPVEVREARRYTLGLRWLTNYARLRNEKQWKKDLQKKLWMLPMDLVVPLRNVKILTVWLKQIKHLLIINGNRRIKYNGS